MAVLFVKKQTKHSVLLSLAIKIFAHETDVPFQLSLTFENVKALK